MSNLIFYPSFNNDETTERYSCGGLLKISDLQFNKLFVDIEYNEIISGTIDFYKIFIHNLNSPPDIEIFFKTPPETHYLIIPFYNDYIEDKNNLIINVFNKQNLRLFTHFELYERAYINTNKIKLKKLKSNIYKFDNLAPDLWKDVFPNYKPKYLDIGDKIILIHKTPFETIPEEMYEIVNLTEFDDYYFIELDRNLNKTYYQEFSVASHYFKLSDLIDLSLITPKFENFYNSSRTGNYRINLYPIELNIVGTITEKVKIEFIGENICNVIFLNNNISYGPYDISLQNIEVYNNFINGNPIWFRMIKEGFIGTFNQGDYISFDIYGQDIPIWFFRYVPKNSIPTSKKQNIEIVIK